MPRYVVLHHRTPPDASKPDHFDLMLEDADVLKTFTLWEFPTVNEPVLAIPDFDHRRAYLDYEGPISQNRGEVTQADAGTFEWQTRSTDQIVVVLTGKKLNGTLVLQIQLDSTGGTGSDSVVSG